MTETVSVIYSKMSSTMQSYLSVGGVIKTVTKNDHFH
jgi:hypothetical protein